MFKKSKRVKKQLFPHILKKGKVYYSKHFTLRVVRVQIKEAGKLSVVVSKKTDRRAVKRNQFRRRCLHALKENLTSPPSFIGVFFVKKGISSLSFKEMKDELKDLLLSAQVFR